MRNGREETVILGFLTAAVSGLFLQLALSLGSLTRDPAFRVDFRLLLTMSLALSSVLFALLLIFI